MNFGGSILQENMTSTPPRTIANDPRKVVGTGCDVWGSQRLELALSLLPLLKEYENMYSPCFALEAGSLLGAWRNGKFIAQDDDFDIAMMFSTEMFKNDPSIPYPSSNEDVEGFNTWKSASFKGLIELKDFLDHRLDHKYAVRLVDSYATKLEVYEPAYGSHLLPCEFYPVGADFHYVTVDIQAYVEVSREFRSGFIALYPTYCHHFFPKSIIFPLTKIMLEGHMFPSPHDVKKWLECGLGYLGEGAVYDKTSGKYVMPENEKSEDAE